MPKAAEDDLEDMMGNLGDFGRYQAWQFSLHIISAVTAGMHMLSLVTVAAVPDHRCAIPEIDNMFINDSTINPYLPHNSTDILSQYIPLSPSGVLDSCYKYNGTIEDNITVPCTSWVYDTTYYQSSRGMEWNFVCNRRWMGAIAQSAYMLGVFFGAVTLGGLADKIGRKTVFCWSATLQLVLGVVVAFMPEYFSFLVVRFFYGVFGSAGAYIPGFVLTMEIVGPSKRTICGIAFQAAFAGGLMLDAAWGALIKDRMILQVVYGLHGVFLFFHWWLMDESPRWLWAQGRVNESVAIVEKAVKMNKRGIPLDTAHYISRGKILASRKDSSNEKTVGAMDLFKTKNIRYKSLNICLCWFANSLVYYGLSLSAGKLQGNPFVIMFVSGLVEMPSYTAIVLLLDRLGRRPLISFMMLTGGICCIVGTYLTQGSIEATSIIMLGKFFIAGSFAIIYNYSAELFPTVLRNTGLGIGSMCARLSGTLTPLITLLDSFDPKMPSIIFACIALLSGFLTLLLPETMGQPMPQSIEDGEKFGAGDTCFTTGFGRRRRPRRTSSISPEIKAEHLVPLDNMNK
ncbi:organic cation transporter protein [Chrysoperla carnea]|uniref:organic cation transporter protein n=1 Tax=Chrysoperla carnea TaxID=189513 RepID=UPI001D0820E6|nr:organic cation transporter protein [Chrysoperla carnea]